MVFLVFIQGNRKKKKSGVQQGGGDFFLSFLLKSRPSKIDINIFNINQRNYEKYFFARGVQGGRGDNIFIFFIIRDRTFNIHINISILIININEH